MEVPPSSKPTRRPSWSGTDLAPEKLAHDLAELPPTLTIERAAKLLGLSRSSAYRAAANGQLPTLAFGRRLFVPTVRLLEMLGFPIEERP